VNGDVATRSFTTSFFGTCSEAVHGDDSGLLLANAGKFVYHRFGPIEGPRSSLSRAWRKNVEVGGK